MNKSLLALVSLICLACLAYSQITPDECQRDCTLDWIDCVHICQSGGNEQKCHQSCERIVKACNAECPQIICFDVCRIQFEDCREEQQQGLCLGQQTACQKQCERQSVGETQKEDM